MDASSLGLVDISDIPFDPTVTFSSGQTFRWLPHFDGREGASWIGIIDGLVVKITKNSAQCTGLPRIKQKNFTDDEFSKLVRAYLSSEDDLKLIKESLPKEAYLSSALNQFRGLRILKQDPWECLISFICSINKNIPAISAMIDHLCESFGEKLGTIGNKGVFAFPTASALFKASKSDLLTCKVGFRWKFIKYLARQVAQDRIDLGSLRTKSYDAARKDLIAELSGNTFGVGPKVADCVLLFSIHNLEAFPLDVWMLRCIRERYARHLGLSKTLSDPSSISLRRYELLHTAARSYFGKYCGYAQQYLYMKVRSDSHSK